MFETLIFRPLTHLISAGLRLQFGAPAPASSPGSGVSSSAPQNPDTAAAIRPSATCGTLQRRPPIWEIRQVSGPISTRGHWTAAGWGPRTILLLLSPGPGQHRGTEVEQNQQRKKQITGGLCVMAEILPLNHQVKRPS